MASKKAWVIELVASIVKDVPTAEMVVERLIDEGLLHLGYGNADVDLVIQTFSDTFGTTKVTKRDRFAAHRLVQKYGSQSVAGIIKLLAEHSTEKYAPVVGSISQLEDKWVQVMHFLRNSKAGEVEINA